MRKIIRFCERCGGSHEIIVQMTVVEAHQKLGHISFRDTKVGFVLFMPK